MERAEYERMAVLEDDMWWFRALHARLIDDLRQMRLPPGALVLDAGCGTGGFLRRAGAALPGIVRIGLDVDAGAATIAAAKSNAAVLEGTVNALPFKADSFDAIVSADVLYHRRVDDANALVEFLRCLKPGGSLLLNLPAYAWMTSAHDTPIHTARRYTATGARRMAGSAGFRVAGSGYWNSLLFPLMVVHRMARRRAQTGSDVRPFPLWQDRAFRSVTAIERGMARIGLRLPFGGSVWVRAVKP